MLRSKRMLVLSILVLAFLAALGAGAASAEEAAGLPAVTGDAPAVQPCGLNLEALSSEAAAGTPAVTPESALPDFMAPATGARLGYCRCGCGVRCSKDSDCGAGGNCVSFVTCC
jgi:hypothetical protein